MTWISGEWKIVCKECNQELPISEFYKNPKGKYGRRTRCKECQKKIYRTYNINKDKQKLAQKKYAEANREKLNQRCRDWRKINLKYDAYRARLYRTRKEKQCPAWANIDKIKEMYLNCPPGYHVDHIIPLKGLRASGLHVEHNLQYLPKLDNLRKRNLYGWDE